MRWWWPILLGLLVTGLFTVVCALRRPTSTAEGDILRRAPPVANATPTLVGRGAGPLPTNRSPGNSAAEAPPSPAVRVSGRVLLPSRLPAEGAIVRLRVGDLDAVSVEADLKGRYEAWIPRDVVVTGSASGAITAEVPGVGSGRSLFTITATTGASLGIPPTIVHPASTLTVLAAADHVAVQSAHVTLVARHHGRSVPIREAETDSSGMAQLVAMPHGDYRVVVSSPVHGRGQATIRLTPGKDVTLRVALLQSRRVLVTVRDERGQPVAGAVVEVENTTSFTPPWGKGVLSVPGASPTDADGRATVSCFARDRAVLIRAAVPATASGSPPQSGSALLEPSDTAIAVRLQALSTVHFPLTGDWIPAPGSAVTITLSQQSPPSRVVAAGVRGVIDGDGLSISGVPPGVRAGWAAIADDRVARFEMPARGELSTPIVFRKRRSVRFLVLGPDETPVQDLLLRLSCMELGMISSPKRTDENGLVALEGASGTTAVLQLCSQDSESRCRNLAALRVDELSDPHPVRVPREVPLRLLVTVDGEARIPDSYSLAIDGWLTSDLEIEEDIEGGRLSVTHRPQTPEVGISLSLRSPGFATASAQIEGPLDGGGLREVTLVLRSANSIEVSVLEPVDGVFSLGLWRLDDAHHAWARAPFLSRRTTSQQGAGGSSHLFEDLPPGEYRVQDLYSLEQTVVLDALRSGESLMASLDLRRSVEVTVYVRGPVGEDLSSAAVVATREGQKSERLVGANGTFAVRALRGESLRVKADHESLVPAEVGGDAEIVVGDEAVTLRLEHGSQMQFTLVTPGAGTAGEEGIGLVAVRMAPTGENDAEWRGGPASWTGKCWQCRCVESGILDVLIDVPGYAPIVRTEVAVTRRVTDLGALPLSCGGRVRVQVRTRPGEVIPVLWATVRSVSGEHYSRGADRSEDGVTLLIRGLRAGRHRVVVGMTEIDGGLPRTRVLLEEEIDLYTDSDTSLQVDLR